MLLVCRRQSAKTLRWHPDHLDFERSMRFPLGKTRKLMLLSGCGFSEQDYETLQCRLRQSLIILGSHAEWLFL